METKPNGPLSWEEAINQLAERFGHSNVQDFKSAWPDFATFIELATSRVQALEEENKRLQDELAAYRVTSKAQSDSYIELQERLSAADEVIPIIRFLLGEAEFDGYCFGERHNKEIGTYWWRKYLRTFLEKYNSLKK